MHLGYHYPRDLETAQQCKRGFKYFIDEYEEAVLKDFPNYYFISSNMSQLSFEKYIEFCDIAELDYQIIKKNELTLPVQTIEGGIK